MRNNQTGQFEPIDYIGQIFNGRKIIKRIPNATHNRTSKYIAECVICGKQVTRSMYTLKHGASCDCQEVSIHEQRIGEIYGCMKIVAVLPHVKDKQRKYLCECIYCGEQSKYTVSDLKELKSLRCFHINNNRHRARDYTWKFPRLGGIYRGMFIRCYNKKAAGKNWKYYGGKGIEVCKEWQEFPEKFQEWALTHGYQDDLTIDRIDSNKNYCPENCQWITLAENVKRAGETILEVNGIIKNLSEWSKHICQDEQRVGYYYRTYGEEYAIQYIKDMMNIGYNSQNKNLHFLTINGIVKSLSDWSREINISPDTLSAYCTHNGDEETIRHIQEILTYGYDKYAIGCPFVVDGVSHSNKEWTKILGLSKGRLTKLKSKHGYDAVVDFIREKLKEQENYS